MSNSITINNKSVLVRQYKGQRILTLKDIDAVHGRPDGTARRNFNVNKKRFIEGEDYFVRNSSEAKKEFGIVAPNGIALVTESGYLMLAKSFTDDLSWEIQRQLVNSYFKYKETKHKDKQLELYNYFDKKYKGEPVLSSMDVSYFININYSAVDWYARTYLKKGMDYYCLKGEELKSYKLENPEVSRLSSTVVIFTRQGFDKICKAYGITVETPKLFLKEEIALPVKSSTKYENVEMDDYITALRVLRATRKEWLNILEKNKIEAFDTCVHYVCMAATANSI